MTSRDIDNHRILQSDWTRAFLPITCELGYFSDMRYAQENRELQRPSF